MMFNQILTTAVKQVNESGIIIPEMSGSIYLDTQEVLKVGPSVAQVKEGDIIFINTSNFMKRKTNTVKQDLVKEYHEVTLPIENFGSVEYMKISDRDILYFYKGDE